MLKSSPFFWLYNFLLIVFPSWFLAPFLILLLVIEEANWLTLYDDIEHLIGNGFDAVICLGNSFAHMLDNYGDQREQKLAIANFERCVRPGGLLFIDHRNYDSMISTGSTPVKNIYYNVSRSNTPKS